MRPTREGRSANGSPIPLTNSYGTDPGGVTEEPPDPTDRAQDGAAFVPFQPPPEAGPSEDLNLSVGTDSDGGGNRPVVSPTLANDGNNATIAYRASFFNGGGTKTWWVKADLGAAYEITDIVIRGGFGNSGENDPPWEIQHSPDGSTWTTAVGSYVWNGATTPRTATLTLTSSQTKRYWRVGQTITYTGLIYPVKVHTLQINGTTVGDPPQVLWTEAPLTIDGDDATFDDTDEDAVDGTGGPFWRGTLDDTYLIASVIAELGFEDAGAVTVLVQAGNDSDYSDAATVATLTATATGSYTADTLSGSVSATDVFKYWQLVLDTAAQGIHVHEVSLLDPATFTGQHGDLSGRDVADQHPADAVSFDPTGLVNVTATDVQGAIEELDAATTSGNFETYNEGGNPLSQDHGTLGATETIDATLGNHHRGTLDQACTITVAPFGDGSIEVVIYQDGTGGNGITWSGVDFGGSDAQPDQTANAPTVYTFLSDDGNVYGFKAGEGVTALDDLTDVTITSAAEGHMLFYRSGSWVNEVPDIPTTIGWILVDGGTTTVDPGPPPEVTVTTDFGIDGGGDPYYDAGGAATGEEAALYWDPTDLVYHLVPYNFP